MRVCSSLVLLAAITAGAQGTKVDVPTTASLRGLSVTNQNVIWASGTAGTVIKTSDGGKTWSVIVVPGAETLDFRGTHAFDDKNALVMSSGPAEQGQARIYRTQDGGKSWQQVFEDKRPGIFFDAIAFWDRQHGIVLSDPLEGHFALFRTNDGGVTWKQLPPAALPAALPNEGAFAASNSCLTVQGERNVWFATGGANIARVFRSSDRGQTWSVAETPLHPTNASSGIFSLAFWDAMNGIAVGGDYAHPEASDLPNILFSRDGGRSWQVFGQTTDPPGEYLSSVATLPRIPQEHRGYFVAAGHRGMIFFGPRQHEMGGESMNTVATTGGKVSNVWAVGPKGGVHGAAFEYEILRF